MHIWLQQFIIIVLASVVASWIKSGIDYSIFIGGMIYLIPNIYFGLYAFKRNGTYSPQLILLSFYRGEMGKFLLSSVGFAVAFTLVKSLDGLLLFSTYIVLTVIQCIQIANIK